MTERARIVIGADGRNSLVARSVGAPTYDAEPALTCAYYTYWSGVAVDGVELYPRPGRMIVASPTNDGRVVMIVVLAATSEFHEVRADIEGHFQAALELAPGLAERIRAARARSASAARPILPNFFRRPYGDGWALVGDAGYHKDPILALGISDAFRDAELLAEAVDAGLTGRRPLGRGARRLRAPRATSSPRRATSRTLEFARLQAPAAGAADAVRRAPRRPGADEPALRHLRRDGGEGGVLLAGEPGTHPRPRHGGRRRSAASGRRR